MADTLGRFADELEKAADFDTALQNLICRELTLHQRILFNGNGYSQAWEEEAAQRGLSNLRTTAQAMHQYIAQKNIDLVTRRGIYSETEYRARHDIHVQTYCKILRIEAQTTLDMAIRQIIPAVSKYSGELSSRVSNKRSIGVSCVAEADLLQKLSDGIDALYAACEKLRCNLAMIPADGNAAMEYYSTIISADMNAVRTEADALEPLTDKASWPFPTYSDILFY